MSLNIRIAIISLNIRIVRIVNLYKFRTFCRFHGGGDDKIRPANDDILLRLELRG